MNYKITKENFAEGAFGIVHVAEDAAGKTVALKILKNVGDEGAVSGLKKEYKRLAALKHPNIVGAVDFGFDNGHYYFVSEFVDGAKNIFEATANMKPEEMVPLFSQVLAGLDFLHRNGVVHLDIKPTNILVDRNGRVKIIDLGVASAVGSFKGGAVVGSLEYVAPEVIIGSGVDGKCDLFSFGVVAYHCIARDRPFNRHDIRSLLFSAFSGAAGVDNAGREAALKEVVSFFKKEKQPVPLSRRRRGTPEHLAEIIETLLKHNPAERGYPNARAVIYALATGKHSALDMQAYLRPTSDKHIGRAEIKNELNEILNDLYDLKQPDDPVVAILGASGLGKSHLLQKVRDVASGHVERVATFSIKLPVSSGEMRSFFASVESELADNKRAILVLVDNFDELYGENSRSDHLERFMDLFNLALERRKNAKVLESVKPFEFVMTAKELSGEVAKHARKFEVTPLSKQEVLFYLKETPIFKNVDISQKWLDNFYFRTSGIPAEIVAWFQSHDAMCAVFNPDGSIAMPSGVDSSVNITMWHGLGAGLRERLEYQLKGLNEVEREIVNLISVWNHHHVLRKITEDDIKQFFFSPQISQVVAGLVERGILEFTLSFDGKVSQTAGGPATSRVVDLANPYMQAIAYTKLSSEDRVLLHDNIAAAFRHGCDEWLLHRAYGSSTSDEKMRDLFVLAQRVFKRTGDLGLATRLLKDALRHTPHEHRVIDNLEALIRSTLARYLTKAARVDEALKVLAGNEAKNHIWKINLTLVEAYALIQKRAFDEALTKLDALDENFKMSAVQKAEVLNLTGEVHLRHYFAASSAGGDARVRDAAIKSAKKYFEDSLSVENLVPKFNLSRVQSNDLGFVLRALGEHRKAIEVMQAKLSRHRQESDPFLELSVLCALASSYRQTGDYKMAAEYANSAIALAKRTGQRRWILTAGHILSNVYHDSGKFELAINEGNKCLASGAALVNSSDWDMVRPQLYIQMADSYRELGRHDRATIFFEAAMNEKIDLSFAVFAALGLAESRLKLGKTSGLKSVIDKAERDSAALPPDLHKQATARISQLKSSLPKDER